MFIIRTALSSIGANKLRAGLTLLGIVIGVAAVISLMSIGRGAQENIISRIEELGTNLLFVRPGSASEGGFFGGSDSATLTLEDARSLRDPVFSPRVSAVAPEINSFGLIEVGRDSVPSQVVGVTPEYQSVRNFSMASGQFISEAHVNSRSTVAVLGSQVAEWLFGFRDPVGQTIRINGRQFTVVGVLESKGGTAFGSQDSIALVPVTTAYYRLESQRTTQGGVSVSLISVQVGDREDMDQAMQDVATVLRLRHRITGEDDFTITNQQETLETLEETTDTFVVFLGAIASISLLVGGIGIMNIMLVSVTERTREIGVRKAMGARRRDVMLQFLMEATVLSLGGGIIGLLSGVGVSRLIDRSGVLGEDFTTLVSADIAVLALVVSAAIGLFFGIYPAMRAARLHPIEALRYE